MDLQLYMTVLWRFRALVAIGVVLAVVLGGLSMFKVSLDGSSPKLEYREQEVWRSDATMFVTQQGFPWGRVQVGEEAAGVDRSGQPAGPRYGDPERFADLAIVYSELAQSDAIRAIMLRDGPVEGDVLAEPMTSEDGDGLPLVGISAVSHSPEAAVRLAQRQIAAFQTYIEQQQLRNGIPSDQRVEVSALAEPVNAALETPRKKTRPLAIFMAVMIATIGMAFVLENLRPRLRPVPNSDVQEAPPPAPQVVRRSA
jgi:hypothetical protein